MNTSIKFTLLFFAFIIITSCNNSKNLPSREEKIIKICIDSLMSGEFESRNESYLVSPYLGPFRFNNYVSKNYDSIDVSYENKKKVLEKLKMNNNDFLELQNRINANFTHNYYSELIDLSKGDESNIVLTFSRVSKHLVFVEVINYIDKIKKEDLLKRINTRVKKDIVSLVIILNKNKIKEITVDEMIFKETW